MKLPQTQRLLEVVHQLRKKCPWDKKQTHRTLIPYLIEEAHEAVDAIQSKKPELMQEELGDVLLQIVLHSEIGRESGAFNFERVAKSIADKMVRRHPHVFGDVTYDKKKHQQLWNEIKQKEKPKKALLDGIPKSLPALQRAQRYGEIAGAVGFDWHDPKQMLRKLKEEIRELEHEIERSNRSNIEMEFGDVVFTLGNLARHLGIDAERSAHKSAEKFRRRFNRVEKSCQKQKKKISDFSMKQLEQIWQSIK